MIRQSASRAENAFAPLLGWRKERHPDFDGLAVGHVQVAAWRNAASTSFVEGSARLFFIRILGLLLDSPEEPPLFDGQLPIVFDCD
jgi:hypothetical protein